MNTLNTVVVIGNLGSDPDIKYFESGSVKASFSIARRISADITDWIPVEVWGKAAETAGNYLRKGSKVEVKGSLKREDWEDRETGSAKSRYLISGWQISLHSKSAYSQEESL